VKEGGRDQQDQDLADLLERAKDVARLSTDLADGEPRES
jgi:hypothetical protein